jgi:MoaA/NifB/PqqE/SkfB family radical SAM enzyme
MQKMKMELNEPEKQFSETGFYFQWHFLEKCNLRCKHCYQEGYDHQGAELSLIDETISQIDRVLSAWDISGRISLTGGEPLCDPQTLYYILHKIHDIENVHHVGILTNGTLLSAEIVAQLKRFPKLIEVQISLDGATAYGHDLTRGNGNFDKAIAGIELLIKNIILLSKLMHFH